MDRKVLKDSTTKLYNDDGQCNIGSYNNSFEELNFADANVFKSAVLNKLRLTQWQAFEIKTDDHMILIAPYKMGVLSFIIAIIHDLKTQTNDYYHSGFKPKKSSFSRTLLKGSTSMYSKNARVIINNLLDRDTIQLEFDSKKLIINAEFIRISTPIVSAMPLTDRHSLYTEKDLMKSFGTYTYKGKTYSLNNQICIMDDHRGFYPFKSGYDWFTTFGVIKNKNNNIEFGINLTIFDKHKDPDKYTENGYWWDGMLYKLSTPTFEWKDDSLIVEVKDQLSLVFKKSSTYSTKMNLLLLKIDYTLLFGCVTGYIIHDGKKHSINHQGLAEQRHTKL